MVTLKRLQQLRELFMNQPVNDTAYWFINEYIIDVTSRTGMQFGGVVDHDNKGISFTTIFFYGFNCSHIVHIAKFNYMYYDNYVILFDGELYPFIEFVNQKR